MKVKMYYKKSLLKTKVITPGNKDILEIGLDQVGYKYQQLMKEAKEDWNEKRLKLRDRLEYAKSIEWNKTHETSYEDAGDLEELERDVDAKMGIFCNLGSEQRDEWDAFIKAYATSSGCAGTAHMWMFPQMLTYIARNIPIVRNSAGNVSAYKMFATIGRDDIAKAILAIFMYKSRGVFLNAQNKKEQAVYGRLTPLFMYAYKKDKDIAYSEWERSEIEYVVEAELAEAMLTEIEEIDTEELLRYRREALTVKTGKTAGEVRSTLTTYKLFPSGDSPLCGLNELSTAMLCQTWLAHPDNRHASMILDPDDWDNMPEPLITPNVIKSRNVRNNESFNWVN
jgi:hypothetical protein